jgi:hypothetical protein
MNNAPKARFCGCPSEPKKRTPGNVVFLKEKGVLTLNAAEASDEQKKPVGVLDGRGRIIFMAHALESLSA